MSRRRVLSIFVLLATMGLFMAFYISTIAGDRWYFLAPVVLVGMAVIFVLTNRWAVGRYETRTPEQLNAKVPDRVLGITAIGSPIGFAIFQAGGPVLLVILILIPFFFSFVCGVILFYYQRIAVKSADRSDGYRA